MQRHGIAIRIVIIEMRTHRARKHTDVHHKFSQYVLMFIFRCMMSSGERIIIIMMCDACA